MNFLRILAALALPLAASAEWAVSPAKAEAEAKARRSAVLILVWAKGDAESERLEKDLWSVEPVRTLLREFVALKVEKPSDPKTWAGVPRWKAQGEGEAVVPELRVLHPWGKERTRIALKGLTAAQAGEKLQAAIDSWEKEQGPIRADVKALESALKNYHTRDENKDLMFDCARKVVGDGEPWTLPTVAACLYVVHVEMRKFVIPELRRLDAEEGLQYLLKWLDDQATQPGCDLGWQEVGKAADPRTLPKIKDGILNNSTCAATRVRLLGQIKDKSNIPFLIDLFSKVAAPAPVPGQPEKQSLQDDIARSLGSLTGQNFGKEIQKWKDWWKSAGAGFEIAK